ncbi:uncharacterized protein [Chironomus tepperi]|uniref:uncharacterized protein n=1 Tax=Chironomus tepperi TaxID=113505 RepID=UPI00391F2C8B
MKVLCVFLGTLFITIAFPTVYNLKHNQYTRLELINVIDEIISNQTFISTVNYIDSVNDLNKYTEHHDFVTEIFKDIGYKLAVNDISRFLDDKSVKKRWFFNLIRISSLKDFSEIIKKFSHRNFDYGGYYIILFADANTKEVSQVFQILWDLYIYNVNLIRNLNESITIETFFPFNPQSCNTTVPIEIASLNVTTFESIGPAVLRQDYANGTYRLHGRDIDILHTIAENLNFHPKIFFNKTYGGWGFMNSDGSSGGAFGAAKLRITDLAFGNVNLKVERAEYLGYTIPYAADIFVFIIPPGRPLSSFEKLLRPFDATVWTYVFIIFGVGFFIILVLDTRCNRQVKNFVYGTNVQAPHMNFLTAIVGGSQRQLPRALYQGSLYEFLQSESSDKEPQTIEEMAQKEYKFYMIVSYDDFTKENVHMKGRKRVISPEVIKKLMVDVLDYNFQGTLMLKMSQVVYSNRERSRKNEQLYRICKEYYMSVPISMYFPKNSYLVDLFNNLILLFHQSGLMSYWTSVNEDPKYLNIKPQAERRKITMDHLSGPFKIWFT